LFDVLRDRRFVDAAAGVLIVYLITLAIMPKRVFWTPDEGAKWMTMHSVHVGKGLDYIVEFPSQRVDTEYKYLPHFGIFPKPIIMPDRSVYLAFETPILFPLLSSVPYRLFGISGIYVLPLLGGWLAAVAAGVIAAAIRRDCGPPAILIAGLATSLWFYSQLFWEHTPACLLGMAAAAIVVLVPRSVVALLAAMTLPAAASAFRMESLALAFALPFAWAVAGYTTGPARDGAQPRVRWPLPRWTLPVAMLIGAAGVVLFLDALLTVRHHFFLSTLPERIATGSRILTGSPWLFVETLIHTSVNEAAPIDDIWVEAALLGVVLCGAAAFTRPPALEAVLFFAGAALLLSLSVPLLLQWNMYRAVHGVVPVAPFVAVWLYAWAGSAREQRGYAVIFLTVLLAVYLLGVIFAIGATYVEAGKLGVGIEWGQRYALTFYPLATVLCVVAVRRHWESARPAWLRRGFATAVALMVLVALGFQLRGLGMLYNSRMRLAGWEQVLRQEGPVVTDVWWLPAALAVFFTEHELYYVYHREHVADWVEAARERGIRGFTFVSTKPVKPKDLPEAAVLLTAVEPADLGDIVLTRLVIAPPEAAAAGP
jgi:hypothetical protein